MRNYLKYALYFLLPGLLAGCIADDNLSEKGGTTTGKEARVKVTLQMPSASAPGTYAISTIDENCVETIDVLAFKPDTGTPSGWAFAYQAEGTSITDQPVDNPIKAKKQFNVTLIKDKDHQQTLVILANVRSQLDALGQISEGADRDALLARLDFAHTGKWDANNDKPDNAPDKTFTPFPMWGETTATVNDATTEINNVSLLRGIARLDVVLADPVANFSLDEIYIYNSKNKGRVVPDRNNLDTINRVKAATVAEGSINNATPLVYEVPTGMERLFERTVYLFEAKGTTSDKSSEATCVVVGGKFGTDTETTYYRLDFFKKDSNNNYTKDYRDILRNHRYRANIISVSGSGYPTPEDAFNSKSLNMQAEVKEWDDGDMGDVVFDGQYMLAVSQKLFELPRDMRKCDVYIETDYDVSPNAGWKAVSSENWLALSSISPSSGGTVTDGIAKGNPDEKLRLVFTVSENTSGTPREATIKVTAGRLTQVITVRQSITPDIDLKIIDSTGKEINDLLFVGTVGNKPDEKRFRVTWAPPSSDVTISVTSLGADELFKFYTAGHDNILNGKLLAGTGPEQYNIQPSAIYQDDLDNNPFFERASKIDYTVTNGETYLSKYIILRQIVYNLVTVPQKLPFYMMNGKTDNKFSVRVNFPWTAEVLDASNTKNDKKVITLKTQSGSYNTAATGTDIFFDIVDDRVAQEILSAKPIVRFTHRDDPSVYFDVQLSCGLCGIDGTAVKQTIGTKEYLTHFYGTGTNQRCWMVENLAEGTTAAEFSGKAYGQNWNGGDQGGMNLGTRGSYNGYYYTHSQAVSACPAGWHLPTSAEVTTLMSEADTSDRNTDAVSKWWCGSQGVSNSAFAGYYGISGSYWGNWGSGGYWWYGSGGQSFYGGSNGMGASSSTSFWFSVRCVQNI